MEFGTNTLSVSQSIPTPAAATKGQYIMAGRLGMGRPGAGVDGEPLHLLF